MHKATQVIGYGILAYLLYQGVSSLIDDDVLETVHQPPPPALIPPAPRSSEPPRQKDSNPIQWDTGGYHITALAEYAVTATVASIKHYRSDESSDLMPYDMVLAWGSAKDPALLKKLNISQSSRWYQWATSEAPPLPTAELNRSLANTHLIPKDDVVLKELQKITTYDRVQFVGYLVSIKRGDGRQMRSSLTREDSGAGACEVMWVDHVLILP